MSTAINMKKIILFLISLAVGVCSQAQEAEATGKKYDYQHPIPFKPEQYVCYRSPAPLNIDGRAREAAWGNAPWTNSFVDIEGALKPLPTLDTRVKMLWDDDYFYFYARMEEPHIWAKLRERDAVIYQDDDFEIFIDPDGDSHNYYELEVNAFNTLWELILLRPYRVDKNPKALNYWNIPDIKTAVHIEGSLNQPSDIDQYWSVEMAIPWKALKEFAPQKRMPKAGEQWRVNFSRVDWEMEIKDGRYQKAKNPATGKALPEHNWVWSPTGYIAMHMPEQWGYVQFSGRDGSRAQAFLEKPDEAIKWALWKMYFQQLQYFKANKGYTDNLQYFTIPVIPKGGCTFQPRIYTTPHWFEITAASCSGKGYWKIRQDGKIEYYPK
jgi:hypothetical protein